MHIPGLDAAERRFQPEAGHTYGRAPGYLFDQRVLASLVGLVALGLPPVLWASQFTNGPLRQSVSHYYYVPFFGDVFVGALVFIGAMLLAWKGESRSEARVTSLAGLAALTVPLLPTSGPGREAGSGGARVLAEVVLPADAGQPVSVSARAVTGSFFDLFGWAGQLHLVAAGLLFLVLAFLCLVVFTRIDPAANFGPDGMLTANKRRRDGIYRTCGWMILVVIGLMGARKLLAPDLAWWDRNDLTFWCEAAMITAFGASWMVKGRLFGRALLD
jgi:hypothetical protein